ncbi:UDP-N-acetylmuramoyl-tripeptide--D-alanyl-D-alanine ligase [Lachnospiraceae bacterium ZAX-1]
MKNMTLEYIAKACSGIYYGDKDKKGRTIKGVAIDSREIKQDFLFIPIVGAKADGHDFIKSVFENGALASLSERKLDDCFNPYIFVKSCEQALKDIATYYRNQLTIPIVGITGSVGKTSTKEMISSVLSQRYDVLKTAGNYNNEIGLPLTILRIKEHHQVAVVEMGISDFGEMHRLAQIAKPDIGVITNIGMCHLEKLKTRDGVLKAKTEMLEFIKDDGCLILNGDDDKLVTIDHVKNIYPLFYGVEPRKEYKDNPMIEKEENRTNSEEKNAVKKKFIIAKDIVNHGLLGTQAFFHTPKGNINIRILIPGRHNVYNALVAACVGIALDLDLSKIQQGILAASTIGGRANLIEAKGLTIIDDCYNANPVSMKASIDILEYALARKIAVLGDMGELGKDEKWLHYTIGMYVAEKQIDTLFCIGPLSKEMAKGALDTNGRCEVYHFHTIDEMLPCLLEYTKAEDTILVKASHFMGFPVVVEALKKGIA